jgi:hypothetical protein
MHIFFLFVILLQIETIEPPLVVSYRLMTVCSQKPWPCNMGCSWRQIINGTNKNRKMIESFMRLHNPFFVEIREFFVEHSISLCQDTFKNIMLGAETKNWCALSDYFRNTVIDSSISRAAQRILSFAL